MRLDKYTKQAIARSIINDIPKPKITWQELQKSVADRMSAPVKKIYETHPSALKTRFVPASEIGEDYNGKDVICGDVDVRVVLTELTGTIKQYKDVCARLSNTVETCSTLKMLETRLPEFKKYYPTPESPTKNLPMDANLLADIVKLGWKGVKK